MKQNECFDKNKTSITRKRLGGPLSPLTPKAGVVRMDVQGAVFFLSAQFEHCNKQQYSFRHAHTAEAENVRKVLQKYHMQCE